MVTSRRISEVPQALAPKLGVRHLQVLLLFCIISVAYSMRVNLSVAIVAMMDKSNANPDFPEYKWSEQTKSKILSSFFCGYIFTQVPAGNMARRFGGKIILFISVTVGSLLAIFTPYAVQLGDWKLLCAIRMLQGLVQGVTIPSMHTIIAKWAPVEERGSLATYCYSGSQFGTVFMLATSGLLASSRLGWPSIFYLPGAAGLLCMVAWMLLAANSPAESKTITPAERNLIENSLRHCVAGVEQKAPTRVPWLQIFTSPPFLVLMLSHAGFTWGYWTLLTQIPSYMKSVLGQDIKSNAVLSALPYFSMLMLGFILAPISDVLERRKCMSITTSRKVFNTIGQWIPMITLIALGYVTREQSTLAVVLLTFTVAITSTTHLGFGVNHIDLSPHFAGTLVGLTNSAANMMSIIAPLTVGYIVTDTTNPEQWRIIFFIAAGFGFVGNLLFILFGSGTVQPWNNVPVHTHELKPLNVETKETNGGFAIPDQLAREKEREADSEAQLSAVSDDEEEFVPPRVDVN